MKVVEIFKSIQGEGINMGKQAVFVRCGGCNMNPPCSFCDTSYAFTGGTEMDEDELENEIIKVDSSPGMVVFTGGEPMLQSDAIYEFVSVSNILCSPTIVAMETNGTIKPIHIDDYVDHFAVSPKLATACKDAYDLDVLADWAGCHSGDVSVEFKFVITCPQNVEEAHSIVKNLHLFQWDIPIIFQPNGFKEPYDLALREVSSWLEADKYLNHRVRVLPQLHRIMWGKDARGI